MLRALYSSIYVWCEVDGVTASCPLSPQKKNFVYFFICFKALELDSINLITFFCDYAHCRSFPLSLSLSLPLCIFYTTSSPWPFSNTLLIISFAAVVVFDVAASCLLYPLCQVSVQMSKLWSVYICFTRFVGQRLVVQPLHRSRLRSRIAPPFQLCEIRCHRCWQLSWLRQSQTWSKFITLEIVCWPCTPLVIVCSIFSLAVPIFLSLLVTLYCFGFSSFAVAALVASMQFGYRRVAVAFAGPH